ncbi:MAG TPA: site-specific integrase [Verrucomicrobia bacterium]|nr:site-specific integrase [Verrucomicrobiota bacterium]
MCHCNTVKVVESPGIPRVSKNGTNASVRHERGHYQKVVDGRKRPIRGLWKRGNRFYARLSVEDRETGKKETRRIPLEGATTIAEAKTEMEKLKVKREENTLPVLRQAPRFDHYADQYLNYFEKVPDAKRPHTIATEKGHLKRWKRHLRDTRINKITKPQIRAFIEDRQAEGLSARTVNLSMVCLRNVLNRAIEDGWIASLPTENIKPLKSTPRKRRLFSLEEINSIRESAVEVSRNGRQLADFLHLLAFCGGRMSESLRLKWEDVDWDNRQLTIGADGMSKNRKSRVVDFNPNLEKHLGQMFKRSAPDSAWIFPSPQRGMKDIPARSFRESLILARDHSSLPDFGFHDCRHFFISFCVMSGIDYMTIAKWAGHSDGGILIGKIYGHLNSEHARRQAERIRFTSE